MGWGWQQSHRKPPAAESPPTYSGVRRSSAPGPQGAEPRSRCGPPPAEPEGQAPPPGAPLRPRTIPPGPARGLAVSIRSGLTLPRPPLCLRTNPSNGATPPTRSICTARFRLQGPTRSICIARFRLHGTWLHPSPSHRDSASGPSRSESVSRSTKPRPLPNISSSTFGSSRLGRMHSLTPASGSALGRHQLPSSRNLRPRPLLLQALPSWGVLAPRPNPIGEAPPRAPAVRSPLWQAHPTRRRSVGLLASLQNVAPSSDRTS